MQQLKYLCTLIYRINNLVLFIMIINHLMNDITFIAILSTYYYYSHLI